MPDTDTISSFIKHVSSDEKNIRIPALRVISNIFQNQDNKFVEFALLNGILDNIHSISVDF